MNLGPLARLSAIVPIGVLIALVATSVFAAPPQPPPALPSSPVSIGGVLQVLFGLAVVLGTVAGAAWLLKRLAPGQIAAGGAIKLIGGIAVGPKERVVVVEVGDTWVVVGVAPGQVNALHHMPRLETFQGSKPATDDQRFASWLKDVMKRRGMGTGSS